MDGKILDKIKKLLALGQSTNPHEAANAVSKAQQLMQEYQLTMQDVELTSIGEVATKMTNTSRKQPRWHVGLIHVVCSAFGVEPFVQYYLGAEPICKFIGRHEKIEVAVYFYVVLSRRIKQARRQYISTLSRRMKAANRTARADLFCEGWVHGVARNITKPAQSEKEAGLIKEYIRQRYPFVIEAKSRATNLKNKEDSLYKGYAAGMEVEVNTGVPGQERKQIG
nr:DUF2786 domain-containing protein [uncultured Desulfobulbus sp.]